MTYGVPWSPSQLEIPKLVSKMHKSIYSCIILRRLHADLVFSGKYTLGLSGTIGIKNLYERNPCSFSLNVKGNSLYCTLFECLFLNSDWFIICSSTYLLVVTHVSLIIEIPLLHSDWINIFILCALKLLARLLIFSTQPRGTVVLRNLMSSLSLTSVILFLSYIQRYACCYQFLLWISCKKFSLVSWIFGPFSR